MISGAGSAPEFPALILEVLHRRLEFLQRVLFANNLKNNVAHPARFLDGLAQPVPVDHSRSDRIVTPGFRSCIGNMHQSNGFVMGEQALYWVLTYVRCVGDVINDLDRGIVYRADDASQILDGRGETIGGVFEEESRAGLFGQRNEALQALVQPPVGLLKRG